MCQVQDQIFFVATLIHHLLFFLRGIHIFNDPFGMRADPGICIWESDTTGLHPGRDTHNIISHYQSSTGIPETHALAHLRKRAYDGIVDEFMPHGVTGPASLIGYDAGLQSLQIIGQLAVGVLELHNIHIRSTFTCSFTLISKLTLVSPQPETTALASEMYSVPT